MPEKSKKRRRNNVVPSLYMDERVGKGYPLSPHLVFGAPVT
ncbi:MAG: hypothetical protein SWE60_10270 [Thermodesulfobacteriota bacterium]|nr:hypothetical protein [Thermodesulfobacteriota bacterium]